MNKTPDNIIRRFVYSIGIGVFQNIAAWLERKAGTAQRTPECIVIRYRYGRTARDVVRVAVNAARPAALVRL